MRVIVRKHSESSLTVELTYTEKSLIAKYITLEFFSDKKHSTLINKKDFDPRKTFYTFLNNDTILVEQMEALNFIVCLYDENDNKIEESRPFCYTGNIRPRLQGVVNRVIQDFNVVAKNYNGSKAFVYKKLPGRVKCKECWDEDLESSTNTQCKSCGGSGYEQLYAYPIKMFFGPIQAQKGADQLLDEGRIDEIPSMSVTTTADISLWTGDIFFYELTGDWFIILQVTASSIMEAGTLQTIFCNYIPSNAPEMRAAIKAKALLKNGINATSNEDYLRDIKGYFDD